MDEVVRRAMARWPNVPAVFGWLRLDRRGNWHVRLAEGEPARFDRVTNPALIGFIGRNYASDDRGRRYFQNGPQRVYVSLDFAPWIVRLDDAGEALVTHTDRPVNAWSIVLVDDEGTLLIRTELGAAVLLDRDLSRFIDALESVEGNPLDAEALIDRILAGGTTEEARVLGRTIRFEAIRYADMESHLGFVREPLPD